MKDRNWPELTGVADLWSKLLPNRHAVLAWEPDSTTIEMRFEDAEPPNNAINPVPAEPVPLRITLERNGTDYASVAGFHFVKNPRKGSYTVGITGLDAGTYFLSVELLYDNPLLSVSENTYAPDLQQIMARGDYPTYTAVIVVKRNLLIVWFERVVAALALLIAVALAGGIIWRILNWWGPLSGTLVLFRRKKDSEHMEEVWRGSLPSTWNAFRFPHKTLPLAYPCVDDIEVWTGRSWAISRAGQLFVNLTVNGDMKLGDFWMQPGGVPEKPFYTDPQDTQFFLVKDPDPKKIV